jgi:phage terminase large subunit-like protein
MHSQQTPEIDLSTLSTESLLAAKEDFLRARQRDRISALFPDDGPLRRELYVKHCEFFRLGAEFQERCFMAANRVGKSVVGAYETTLHLTGEYPHWWEGRRFDRSIDAWAAGDTSETTRDIVQLALLGPPGDFGTGLIPWRKLYGEPRPKRGITDSIDTVAVRHASGGNSTLGFKAYDQGRRKFQGTARHLIWLDEEPPADVYDECLLRLMTTNGIMLCTFTPLQGLSEVALRFMPHLAPQPDPDISAW